MERNGSLGLARNGFDWKRSRATEWQQGTVQYWHGWHSNGSEWQQGIGREAQEAQQRNGSSGTVASKTTGAA